MCYCILLSFFDIGLMREYVLFQQAKYNEPDAVDPNRLQKCMEKLKQAIKGEWVCVCGGGGGRGGGGL